jgi:hypothetical protein
MTEVKYRTDKGSPEKRIADRLKNSGEGLNADVTTKTGDSARRTFHNIHHSASQHGSIRDDQKGGADQRGDE